MTNQKKDAVITDEVHYRKASFFQMMFGTMNNAVGMCFYMLMMYASYIGSSGYGVATAMLGVIATGTRIFDGITDPLIAMLIDKTNTRFGKIRIWMVSGWLLESLSVLMLINWFSEKGLGTLVYILIYLLYYVGYTMNSVAGLVVFPVMTNDPKQRPLLGVFGTVYSYLVPMIISILMNVVILPRFGNQYSTDMLRFASMTIIGISFIFLLFAVLGTSSFDKPETFKNSMLLKKDPVRFRDMWNLVKSNRALQMFIVAASSDKFAQQTAGQAIITTMFNGILIGNMQIATLIATIAMLPSILFAVVGARYAGKHGSKKSMTTWTWACIVIVSLLCLWLIIIDPRVISTSKLAMAVYVTFTLLKNGAMMCVTTTNTMMLSDIIDYEYYRTGKYIPAAVSGTYQFVDKLISSLGATLAAFAISFIGYKSTMPQPTDTPTPAIKYMTLFISCGLPILGWICTLVAMRFTPLTKEKMVEVQKKNEEMDAQLVQA